MVRSSDLIQSLALQPQSVPCEMCDGTGICPACDADRSASVRRRCTDCSGVGSCPVCQGAGTVVTDTLSPGAQH
ncbi:MAG: hypothetical protein WCJ30_00795 [Deltaproteobacteria bacterium]